MLSAAILLIAFEVKHIYRLFSEKKDHLLCYE